MVDPSQTVHLKGKEDDPVAMWEQLKSVHLQQRPGARFNAYDDLFSIIKLEEESLQSLANRVDAAMQQIQNLCPRDFILVRKTLKLKFLFFSIYFCPVEPKCNSKCSQTDCGNNDSHTCKYSIVYAPVCVCLHSMIKYSTIYVT